MTELMTLPARTGVALRLEQGRPLKIVNTHGTQVVDCWALVPGDPEEHMSMPHSRNVWYRLVPKAGDALVTNRRRRILWFVEDTSPGIHDTLIPCCDLVRYHQLGVKGHHASCAENFAKAVEPLGITMEPPAPLNLFMNVPIKANGALTVAAPECKPGDHVLLIAAMDCIVVLSACPHDIFPVNGADCTPRDVAYGFLHV